MSSKTTRWINERWPLNVVIRWSLEEEMPGGTSYAYIFGSCVLILFLFQVITGVWQLLYFVPSIDRGYNSVNYLRTEIPFGWLINGLHYWGASAMIVLVGLHISQVFIWGAYKNPRQLTWLLGVGNLLLTLALGLSGPTLLWDERGYWEAEITVSSAGTVPILGTLARNLLAGGSTLGQMTLSRFFFLHVAVLPGILIASVILHLVAFRKFGISGPWDEAKRKRTGSFWPDQVFKDGAIVTLIFVALVGLSAYWPAPFNGPLDLLETFYVPKPEWYFLFFYESLKAFHGVLEPIGTVGIPLLITLLLVFLPFYDSRPVRNPARRIPAMVCYAIFVAYVIMMAIIGYYSKPETAMPREASSSRSAETVPVSSGDPAPETASVKQGEQLFNSLGCVGCHKIKGTGGVIGPELTPQLLQGRNRQWLIAQIRNPKSHNPSSVMPAFTSATNQQVNDLVDFLLSIFQGKPVAPGPVAKGPSTPPVFARPPQKTAVTPAVAPGPHGPPEAASFVIGSVELGAILFHQNCEPCHGPQGKGKVPNPGSTDGTVPPLNPIDPALFNKNAQTFVDTIDPYIQHGSIPEGPNPALRMLAFGDSESLTQQMIANVEAYVLDLNGVDRAQIMHPGLDRRTFFWLVVIVYGLALGGFWIWKGRR